MKTLFLIVFIDLVGFGIMLPLLPFYAQHFGASRQIVTLLFGIYSIGQFIASPILGRLSDKVGRKPILVGSLCCSIAAWILIANAPSLIWLFAGRLFAGLTAGNIATAQAYIADVTTPANRAKGMGLLGAAFGMGFIFGPVLGGVLAGSDPVHIDFAMPAYFSAGLSALALCGTFFLRESLTRERRTALALNPRPGRVAATRRVFANPALKNLILAFFIITTAMALMETSFTIWVNARFGWGPNHVGYIFAYIGVVLAAIQGSAIGPLTKRYGETRVVILGQRFASGWSRGAAVFTQSRFSLRRFDPDCLRLWPVPAQLHQHDLETVRRRGYGSGHGCGAIGGQPVARGRAAAIGGGLCLCRPVGTVQSCRAADAAGSVRGFSAA